MIDLFEITMYGSSVFSSIIQYPGGCTENKNVHKNEEIYNFLGLILIFKCLKMPENAFLESL